MTRTCPGSPSACVPPIPPADRLGSILAVYAKSNGEKQFELKLGSDKTKTISVALGQSAVDIHNLCKPAKVYADDDPWLAAMAVGGGAYVFLFAAEGTPEEMRGRLDPRRGKLYAVLHYPTDSRDNGKFLLPSPTPLEYGTPLLHTPPKDPPHGPHEVNGHKSNNRKPPNFPSLVF